ncbi:hypothetical protein HOLDEFILI_03024 [Holdemania filiformis DSM 12042]|uniref:Uncharacterized protein n=1 Tax=Holdemania filiformis DSM 12042 TaxID=545696 RepID=B9YB16_9FIRM|nr:hypothetical protein HOLDEFILI_03024 [Holdemania filiformis DSM 12042]
MKIPLSYIVVLKAAYLKVIKASMLNTLVTKINYLEILPTKL